MSYRKLVCCMMARNEDWVLGLSVRAALEWCDAIIITDHASTDNTINVLYQISIEYPGRVSVVIESGEFHPLNFFHAMTARAFREGATHVAIIDADEVLSGNLIPYVRDEIFSLPPHMSFELPWVPIVGDFSTRDTGRLSQIHTGFAFCERGETCFILAPEAGTYDIHAPRLPFQIRNLYAYHERGGALMHLSHLDMRRLRAKEVLWKIMEINRWPGRKSPEYLNSYYDSALEVGPLVAVPLTWWHAYLQWLPLVRIGDESWAERQVKECLAKDRPRYAGINTFDL